MHTNPMPLERTTLLEDPGVTTSIFSVRRRVPSVVVMFVGGVGLAFVSSFSLELARAQANDTCLQNATRSAGYGTDELVAEYVLSRRSSRPPPLTRSALSRWMSTRFGIVIVGARRRGRARGQTWATSSVADAHGEMFTSIAIERSGDCPVKRRLAIWYDAQGRLRRVRSVLENCEFVDAAIEEDTTSYDNAGQLVSIRRAHYNHPTNSPGMEDHELSDALTLPDGTMTPLHDALECTIRRENTTATLRCTSEADLVVEARCPP